MKDDGLNWVEHLEERKNKVMDETVKRRCLNGHSINSTWRKFKECGVAQCLVCGLVINWDERYEE